MKVLIIGSGGREHALAWKLLQSNQIDSVFVAPGNAGIDKLDRTQCVKLYTAQELLNFAKENQIDLTIVGNEALLVAGIVNLFTAEGLTIFGPNQQAAQLEGSKVFAKQFMEKYHIKTAAYKDFTDYQAAIKYLEHCPYPTVIKADGLAAGKGVFIAANYEEAHDALTKLMLDKIFAEAGSHIIIEQYLQGVEASILSITDCKVIIPFISAKDHKKIGEGETGLNTGGMGVITPNPYMDKVQIANFEQQIMQPTLHGLQMEGFNFAGIIFFGLMLTKDGIYLLEYNMRFGDPETQAILPMLETDLVDVLQSAISHNLDKLKLSWKQGYSCCVILAADGYPLQVRKGDVITEQLKDDDIIFYAGVANKRGALVTDGGRVIGCIGIDERSLEKARTQAYQVAERISFAGKYYRKDIGAKVAEVSHG